MFDPQFPILFKSSQSGRSLLSWLGKANSGLVSERPQPRTPFLPSPEVQPTSRLADACQAANKEIDDAVLLNANKQAKRRGGYFRYDEEIRAKIGKYANKHGLTAAARHFSTVLEYEVSVTSVQSIRKAFRQHMATSPDPSSIQSLPTRNRGRPILLGCDVDNVVIQHLRANRAAGGVVNTRIAVATAMDVAKVLKPSLLAVNEGFLDVQSMRSGNPFSIACSF